MRISTPDDLALEMVVAPQHRPARPLRSLALALLALARRELHEERQQATPAVPDKRQDGS
jgi:hypothetical protein